CGIDCGATIKYFFSTSNNTFIGPVLEVYQVIYDGSTVGAKALYWDVIDNPPAGAANLTIDGLTGALNGSTLEVVATCLIDGSNDLTAVYTSVGATRSKHRFYSTPA